MKGAITNTNNDNDNGTIKKKMRYNILVGQQTEVTGFVFGRG